MYVNNPQNLKNTTIVTRVMSEYLVGKGFPLLGRENNKYYFSDTLDLRMAIKNTPIWLKLKQFIS